MPAPPGSVKLFRVPLPLREANAFVEQHHRHHGPVQGFRFAIGAADGQGAIHGVAIVGRPLARNLDNGMTAELTRLASDGTPNVCSFLYAACRNAALALGYTRLVTYILESEPGTSLKAAGWVLAGKAGGGSWSRDYRPRVDTHPTQGKMRWEATEPSERALFEEEEKHE